MTDTLVVACGLKAEAKIAVGPRKSAEAWITVVAGGGDGQRLEAELRALVPRARAILSFGIAGGLEPRLPPGSIRVAEAILAPDGRRLKTHVAWSRALARSLGGSLAVFVGVDTPVATIAAKDALHRATGAAVVDMESHIAARVAEEEGLAFAAVRVVADPAERQLPRAAMVGMRPDGRVDIPAVLLSLARDPRQLPGLIRTARDANEAFAGLLRCRQMLGGRFGLVDLGDPLLDMA